MKGIINPGSLRTELVLQSVSRTADGLGGATESWEDIGPVFARLEPIAAAADYGADQTLETNSHRVTLRARADIASGMRFVLGARILDIVAVHDPDETGRYLECETRETGR